MSYDLSLMTTVRRDVADLNYTVNMSAVWFDSLKAVAGGAWEDEPPEEQQGSFGAFGPLRGHSPDAARRILRAAIAYAEDDRSRWKDASNGWGTVEGAIQVMRELLARWTEHPDAVFKVSR